MSGVKLTKAQRELLAELPKTVSDGYRPALRLVRCGLAKGSKAGWGAVRLDLTPAGRAALSPPSDTSCAEKPGVGE